MAIQPTSSDASTVSGSESGRDMHISRNLPTVNTQPVEKCIHGDGQTLDVHSIFRTIQGEGPLAGQPAVFVRLAGCVTDCPLCDTDYTSGRQTLTIDQIQARVDELSDGITLVVITGGEPLRQSCGPLISRLFDKYYRVQIETNGLVWDRTLLWCDIESVTIVCSPKGKIHKELAKYISHLKYVVKEGYIDITDGLPTVMLDLPTRPDRLEEYQHEVEIYVQPCDEKDEVKNKANMQAAIKSCMEFGYTLGIQMHKYAELP